jgi:SAM-dependent methyltransferase
LEFHFTLAKSSSAKAPSVGLAPTGVKASPKKTNKSISAPAPENMHALPGGELGPTALVAPIVTDNVAPKSRATKKTVSKTVSKGPANLEKAAVTPSKTPSKKKSPTQDIPAKTSSTKKSTSKAEPEKSWYDYPHYYDVGFREDTPREAKFFEKAFAKYIPGKVKRVFEPGCGSGRLVVEMAERGFQVTGLDLNQPALDYCKEQLDKKGLKATLINGDMTAFELKRPADAAFNTINTFRHLLTEEDAVKHLKCVAANLRPGGIYILGLHLLPTGGDFYGSEKWKAKEGRTQINYSLTVVDSLPKQRHEKLRITMTIKKGKSVVRVSDHFTLRLYNYRNIKTLFAQVPELVLRDVYDFWYEIDEPQKLDGNIADSVFILQKPE